MSISCSLEDEIEAIRLNCYRQWQMGDHAIQTTHAKHYGTVVGFFNAALLNPTRENRLKVVETFTGRQVDSFKMLTTWECQTLIDALKDDKSEKLRLSSHGAQLIRAAEQLNGEPEYPIARRVEDSLENPTRCKIKYTAV